VACILDGSGKSVKLGLNAEGHLAAVNSVADSVCVTAHACLNMIAPSFNAQAAVDRGYCGNNPNVSELTDAQVQQLLGL